MSYSLDVRRLVAIPFKSGADPSSGFSDCRGLAKETLKRNGRPKAAAMIPGDPGEATEMAARIESGELPGWDVVGSTARDATQLCDLLVGETPIGLHVAVLVCLRPRLILTTYEGRSSLLERAELASWVNSVLRCNE